MKETDLPSPGIGSKAWHLRRLCAVTLSALQVTAPKYAAGKHPQAAKLVTFFTACLAAATELNRSTPVTTFTTAGDATTLAVAATLATTFGKGGSTGAVTYTTSNAARATVNASGVITGVAAGAVTITATMAADANYRASAKSVTITVT